MSTTTSDTPRTYAERYCDEQMALIVDADFAEQLERELALAKAYSQQVVVNITEEMNGLKAGNARLLRELEELRKDKARLDWLSADGRIAKMSDGWSAWTFQKSGCAAINADVRAAIDAAMEASK